MNTTNCNSNLAFKSTGTVNQYLISKGAHKLSSTANFTISKGNDKLLLNSLEPYLPAPKPGNYITPVHIYNNFCIKFKEFTNIELPKIEHPTFVIYPNKQVGLFDSSIFKKDGSSTATIIFNNLI